MRGTTIRIAKDYGGNSPDNSSIVALGKMVDLGIGGGKLCLGIAYVVSFVGWFWGWWKKLLYGNDSKAKLNWCCCWKRVMNKPSCQTVLSPRICGWAECFIFALQKPISKSKKPKVTKGKANDSNQEPSATPAQNGENKEVKSYCVLPWLCLWAKNLPESSFIIGSSSKLLSSCEFLTALAIGQLVFSWQIEVFDLRTCDNLSFIVGWWISH